MFNTTVIAEEYGHIQSNEPIYIGYTVDEDDVAFMDFKLSLKYPLLHSGKPQEAAFGYLPHAYFGFTGRFGQYIGTRNSSPVISKRFNPAVTGRYWLNPNSLSKSDSLDVMYGHESNGQSINSKQMFELHKAELITEAEDPKYARDYISRGWDYVGIQLTNNWESSHPKDNLVTSVKLHYFLHNGLLQGKQEEYNDWENKTSGKRRKDVDGLTFSVSKNFDFNDDLIRSEKIVLEYTTGIDKTFEYNTVKFEVSFTVGNLPIAFWSSYGYNSDLADYYRELHSTGIALEFGEF